MSFLDTLKNLGLWQQPQAQQQPNPYGLSPEMVKQARMQALGNIGGQIMAMSAQMTPDQRARMMGQADWTGGMQSNLYNAAQMQLMGDAQRRRKLEADRAEEARTSIAEMIKKTPPGRLRDAAFYFFQAGDYGKAGELLFKQERRFNPYTANYEVVDAFGSPISAPATAAPQPSVAPSPVPVGAPEPAPGPSPIPTPEGTAVMPEPAEAVDPVTQRWRIYTKDPNLTPQEAQQLVVAAEATGSANDAMKVHREIIKNRQDLEKEDRQATKEQSDMANAIVDDRTAQVAEPAKVVQFAQSIEDALASGNPSGMRALATQVLFAKVLDPGSAFMTGEAELQQLAASMRQKVDSWWNNLGGKEGAPVPAPLVLEMREISRILGRKALQKIEQIDKQTRTRASAFGITDNMLGNPFELRWNRFADPVVSEGGTGMREPRKQVIEDLERYGG